VAIACHFLRGRFLIVCRFTPPHSCICHCSINCDIITPELTQLTMQGGAERHDFHHSNFTGSFGSFFCFWDWLCGTDVPYRAHQLGQVNIDSCSKYWHLRRIFLLCPIILWILCSCFCSSRFCNFCCRLLVVQVQQQEFAVFPFFLTAATVNTGLLSRI
jgi:hypothetical protein